MKWWVWLKKRRLKSAIIIVAGLDIILLTLIFLHSNSNFTKTSDNLTVFTSPTPTLTTIPTPTPTPTATPSPTLTPIPTKEVTNKILFGIGSQAGPAMDFRLVKEAPVHMLTSWYNGTKDLEWMHIQQNDLIPRLYAKKYIVHLITWTDLPEENLETPHGPACGRPYPVSTQVVEDMKQLAQIYNGPGPMYVTVFTEFQTLTCIDNNWIGNENYFNTLKDNFRKIKDIFYQFAPQSKVAISWGGWISRYDDTVNKGGRSLFPYFEDILRESDFAAFQTMESDTNIQEMLDMTRILGSYGKPVMLAHYKPSSGSSDVFDNDMRKLFTDDIMQQLIRSGLFAFSFMDDEMINKSENSYNLVKVGIQKYGK